METVVPELVKALPVAAAMIVVVFAFLRYLGGEREHRRKRDESLEAITDRCIQALLKNAEAHGACAKVLEQVNTTLIRINGGS